MEHIVFDLCAFVVCSFSRDTPQYLINLNYLDVYIYMDPRCMAPLVKQRLYGLKLVLTILRPIRIPLIGGFKYTQWIL